MLDFSGWGAAGGLNPNSNLSDKSLHYLVREYRCQCLICGKYTRTAGYTISVGATKSCGCARWYGKETPLPAGSICPTGKGKRRGDTPKNFGRSSSLQRKITELADLCRLKKDQKDEVSVTVLWDPLGPFRGENFTATVTNHFTGKSLSVKADSTVSAINTLFNKIKELSK